MVMLPLRELEVLAWTEKVTVPFPLPLLPDVMLIKPALLPAVQLQPVDAVTLTLPVPLVPVKDCPVEEIEKLQAGGGGKTV